MNLLTMRGFCGVLSRKAFSQGAGKGLMGKTLLRFCAAFFFAAAILAGFLAADARAQVVTVYDTTTPNVISITADGYIIHKATVAGTMTAIIRARATGIIADPENPAGRPLLVRATSFASITVRGLDSCSISAGCGAFGLENASTPLARIASLTAMALSTATMFAASGADLNEFVGGNGGGDLLLYHLALANKPGHIKVFVSAGANINMTGNLQYTPLLAAADAGSITAVVALLSADASVNAADENGDTPLAFAADDDNVTMMTILLSAGADANVTNDLGETPLLYAVNNNNVTAVTILLSAGANANVTSDFGETPLIFAALNNNVTAITALLSAGANANAADNTGDTPLLLVVEKNNIAAITALLSAGANVNATNNQRTTPLDDAIFRNYTAAISLLKDNGGLCNLQAGQDSRCPNSQFPLAVFQKLKRGTMNYQKAALRLRL